MAIGINNKKAAFSGFLHVYAPFCTHTTGCGGGTSPLIGTLLVFHTAQPVPLRSAGLPLSSQSSRCGAVACIPRCSLGFRLAASRTAGARLRPSSPSRIPHKQKITIRRMMIFVWLRGRDFSAYRHAACVPHCAACAAALRGAGKHRTAVFSVPPFKSPLLSSRPNRKRHPFG